VLASLALLWAFYQFRVQQLHRQFAIGLEARVNERTRIARDLHDTLLQSFHGLMFEFQAARNMFARNTEKAMEALDSAILGTEEAIAEGRHTIKDLRSEPVAHSDLDQSLTSLSQELAASGNASHNSSAFRLVTEGERKNLSPVVQDDVYQIAREALRNAFRHARAERVEVEIRYDADEFRLRVRDDGKGIDPAVLAKGGVAGHFGLSGMRERAKTIGAQLKVWSEAGAGTEIQLTIPAAVAYERFSRRSRFTLFRKEKS
jgi:signal transduction histidine kinase